MLCSLRPLGVGTSSRSAALAEIGSIPESRKRERSDLGILVSHEDGPCGDAPSRRRDLPELVAAWNRSQKEKPEIIITFHISINAEAGWWTHFPKVFFSILR